MVLSVPKSLEALVRKTTQKLKREGKMEGDGYNGAGKRKHKKKHHKKRGGEILGIDFASKIAELVAGNSFVQELPGMLEGQVPPDYYPSKVLKAFDLAARIPDAKVLEGIGMQGAPRIVAEEIQAGLISGLDAAGAGRRRRRGRPSLQSKRARARHVSARKRHAKFAHKKVNKKRHSKK
jgi:hypothetical protein